MKTILDLCGTAKSSLAQVERLFDREIRRAKIERNDKRDSSLPDRVRTILDVTVLRTRLLVLSKNRYFTCNNKTSFILLSLLSWLIVCIILYIRF